MRVTIAALAVLLCVPQAAALDIRVGQMWQCSGSTPPFTLVYVIGAIDEMRDLRVSDTGLDEPARVVHIALVGVAELPEATVLKIDHLPMRGGTLTCSGQRFYGEGGVLPEGFVNQYHDWRKRISTTGSFVWHDRPVEKLALERAKLEVPK